MSFVPQMHSKDNGELNVVAAQQRFIEKKFSRSDADEVNDPTPAGACLDPLLKALNWSGEARQLAEAMPYSESVRDLCSLRSVLEKLNYTSSTFSTQLSDITTEMVPCLFEDKSKHLILVTKVLADGTLNIFDSRTRKTEYTTPDDRFGTAYVVKSVNREEEHGGTRHGNWMLALLSGFRPTIAVLLGLTLSINILALSLPLFIMGVYLYAIEAKSLATLGTLLAGVVLLIGTELYLRRVRGRALAYLGTRVENLIANNVYRHLLYMPVSLTETASTASQLSRFRQFEGIRDLFSGSLATALLDIPFLLIFVVAVFWIGGPLGFLPLGLIAIYLVMSIITIPKARALQRNAGISRAERNNFLNQLVHTHDVIHDNSAETVWLNRYREISSNYLINQFKSQQYNASIQTLAQLLVILVGVMTVGAGALLAMEGAMSVGALIATTALIWRGLAPIQSVFLGLGEIGQAIESFKQINRLMQLPQERNPGRLPTIKRSLKGHVAFRGASIRYSSLTEPALRGVSFDAMPGELVTITGDSGSGKSTLLKVIMGLYGLQAGSISIDGLDTRQFDIAELRQSIGYAPQKPSIFSGSIIDNLRLADPTATIDDITHALKRVGILQDINALPAGLDTQLLGGNEHRFSDGFLRQIILARAFLKSSKLYLLDEPASELDHGGDLKLMEILNEIKGRSTVLMTTHRPSHMKLADRVVLLKSGLVAASGPPHEIIPIVLNQGGNKPNASFGKSPLRTATA